MAALKSERLSRTSQKVLDEFDEWARQWGWEQDQGNGLSVDRTEKAYLEADEALKKRVLDLENKVRHWKTRALEAETQVREYTT